jgi:hypothetical protein
MLASLTHVASGSTPFRVGSGGWGQMKCPALEFPYALARSRFIALTPSKNRHRRNSLNTTWAGCQQRCNLRELH